ncbi:MAG: T9SS type A sorting domain-containing protein [bacterium]
MKTKRLRQLDNALISLLCRIITAFMIFWFYGLAGDTFRIATYNILNFPDAMGMQRINYLRTVIAYIEPDVIVVQEMQSQAGVDLFLDAVMNYQGDIYESTTFHDGADTDNAIFYNKDVVQLLHDQYLSTVNRDIAQYRLRFSGNQYEFYLFSLHFKSSQGSGNELIRLDEATALREHLSLFAQGSYFLAVGDFNIYYSDEPAFQYLTGDFSNNNGRLYDPLKASGLWHENSGFAKIHTQSTRFEQLADGGAGGGMDDRFDMVLCSFNFIDSAGLFITDYSYNIVGNDGNHFNVSINNGYNSVVPVDVADALYYASDHLPLFVDIDDGNLQTIPERILKIWPNPMQSIAYIEFPWADDFENARITVTNIIGQRVYESTTLDPNGFMLRRGSLPVGVYFIHVKVQTRYSTINYRSKMAVVE